MCGTALTGVLMPGIAIVMGEIIKIFGPDLTKDEMLEQM